MLFGIFLLLWATPWCTSFIVPGLTPRPHIFYPLHAAGEGFSKKKVPSPAPAPPTPAPPASASSPMTPSPITSTSTNTGEEMTDPASISERQDKILTDLGLEKPAESSNKNLKERIAEEKRLIAIEEKELNRGGNILRKIPAPLLVLIDRFLKGGLALTTVAFVAAGISICVEAATVAFEFDIPAEWDEFIVQTIEPNFTPLLGILLLFSVSLGIFTTIQLGSDEATYKE